jgi:hypothetical protein
MHPKRKTSSKKTSAKKVKVEKPKVDDAKDDIKIDDSQMEQECKSSTTSESSSSSSTSSESSKSEKEITDDEEKMVDLRAPKWKAFYIPYGPEDILYEKAKRCMIADPDDAFPFLAIPATHDPNLRELQNKVSGNVQLVSTDTLLSEAGYRHMFVNEEGKCMGLPFNPDASAFQLHKGDPLVGGAVVVRE